MKVGLFASALVVAATEAASIKKSSDASEAEPIFFAQTEAEQLGAMGLPDAKQLKEKAAKAIDKDHLKKMGKEKHQMFLKVKKLLS